MRWLFILFMPFSVRHGVNLWILLAKPSLVTSFASQIESRPRQPQFLSGYQWTRTRTRTRTKTSTQQFDLYPTSSRDDEILDERTNDETFTQSLSVDSSEQQGMRIRPLHQNWWPLTTVNSLSKTKPNQLQVMGKPLVAYHKSSSLRKGECEWIVLDDRCSHRFAPLSEGRLVKLPNGDCNLQCAYHGWEFNEQGQCVKIPQQQQQQGTTTASNCRTAVGRYPTQIKAGILWAWTDPESIDSLAKHAPIPISPILQEFIDFYGQDSCYMRDLPYGYEILGENLLDVSHLPFSHHGVGALRRNLGGELPMQFMSQKERQDFVKWEYDYQKQQQARDNSNPNDEKVDEEWKVVVVPTLQARILDAGQHDPIFRGFQKYSGRKVDDTWECTAAFYEPNHIRYRRLRGGRAPAHQELFLCPVAPGKSRVFLFNARASIAPSTIQKLQQQKDEHQQGEEQQDLPLPPPSPQQQTFIQRLRLPMHFFNTWKSRMRSAIIAKLFDPRSVFSHMIYHEIFDGDGVFLHKQGHRMAQADLTFRNYSTPVSCDILVNGFRRYLEQAVQVTEKVCGNSQYSQIVLGNTAGAYEDADITPRSALLDRYYSHTVHCPICQRGLRQWRTLADIARTLTICFQGSAGATTALTLLLATSRQAHLAIKPTHAGTLSILTWILSWVMLRAHAKCNIMAQRFIFKDYVHADKS